MDSVAPPACNLVNGNSWLLGRALAGTRLRAVIAFHIIAGVATIAFAPSVPGL